MTRFAWLWVAFCLAACGGHVVVDEPPTSASTTSSTGTGGASTSSSSTSMSTSETGIVATSTGPGPATATGTTTTGPSSCDTLGVCQDMDQNPTNDCVSCSIQTVCASPASACGNDPDCTGLIDCINMCPDQTCQQQCMQQHPNGAMLLQSFIGCVCGTCAMTCAMECASTPA